MKLYIDSCDIARIAELNGMLHIDGVTTNPSIISGSGREPEDVIADLLGILDDSQRFFVQTVRTDFDGIMAEARQIAGLRPSNAFVKIPVTKDGLRAIRECKREGIGVLATAIFSAEQGMLAALNGADCLAPYVNRMFNYTDGVAEVCDLLAMLRSSSMNTEVVAASFKNLNQIHALMKAGIDAVTVPCDLIFKMIEHPGTADAMTGFSKAWMDAYGRDCLFSGK